MAVSHSPRFHRHGLASALAVALLAVPWIGRAEPKPNPAPTEWELKFTFQDPQRIEVHLPGQRLPKTYWYMLYHIVNNTGEDRDFVPVIERVAEIDSELPADKVEANPKLAPAITTSRQLVGLDPVVFRAIKSRHARTNPFLVAPVDAITRVKQGKDNVLDSVAVFDDLDPRVARFTIYVGGLSGERTRQVNPAFDAKKPQDDVKNPRWFVLQKTLTIPYVLAGDPQTRGTAVPALGRISHVMR